uniref:Amino acid transporter transmembrane domain-containing protein n=1 Tax=Ciona intestinalis TaxID=7719 RepID=F6VBN4_CIOIN
MSGPVANNNDDEALIDIPTPQRKGLGVFVASVFIVGTMCGSGILALPKAMVDAGWAGIGLLIICGLISAFTGSILGKCWTILRMRYPEYEDQYIPDPYPTIGFRAAGRVGRFATRFCIIATLYGGATVYLLLIAGNISNLIESLGHVEIHACYWILIITAVLIPFTWLGTPKDFWQAAIMAAVTTGIGGLLATIALIVIMILIVLYVQNVIIDTKTYFLAFGTILFAFGGASVFPTIQVDMKQPDMFPKSVVIGIISVLATYLPICVAGLVVLGDNMTHDNILDELAKTWLLYSVIILITSHLLMAFLIVVNPINQDLEGFFNIADKFSIKRCIVRTSVMLSMLFVALSVPHFGVILSLVGGTTVTATNFIFPPLFYLMLSRQVSENEETPKFTTPPHQDTPIPQIPWVNINVPTYMKLLLIEIILIGLVGGVASTYSVITSLVSGTSGFTVPCYVNW